MRAEHNKTVKNRAAMTCQASWLSRIQDEEVVQARPSSFDSKSDPIVRVEAGWRKGDGFFVNSIFRTCAATIPSSSKFFVPRTNTRPGRPSAKGTGPLPTKVNPKYHLGGGEYFTLNPGVPDIFSRNLPPDKTGLPEGGHTFDEFLQILRGART
jgi:hypothetical protein